MLSSLIGDADFFGMNVALGGERLAVCRKREQMLLFVVARGVLVIDFYSLRALTCQIVRRIGSSLGRRSLVTPHPHASKKESSGEEPYLLRTTIYGTVQSVQYDTSPN